jgi:hypothetical protein
MASKVPTRSTTVAPKLRAQLPYHIVLLGHWWLAAGVSPRCGGCPHSHLRLCRRRVCRGVNCSRFCRCHSRKASPPPQPRLPSMTATLPLPGGGGRRVTWGWTGDTRLLTLPPGHWGWRGGTASSASSTPSLSLLSPSSSSSSDPRRHISLDVGQRKVPLTTLKLCKVWIMLSESVTRRTLSGSEMRF